MESYYHPYNELLILLSPLPYFIFLFRAWGHDQILLQVESDNKVARTFYRKLGFEELLTDMSEKRYDTGGLYLTMVTAPKVLLRKVIK